MANSAQAVRDRGRLDSTFPVPALIASLALHMVLLLGALAGPALFADGPEPLSFIDVLIMPVANLQPGAVAQPAPKKVDPPPPEPEPEPPPLETETRESLPDDIPVLELKKENELEPQPQEEKPATPEPRAPPSDPTPPESAIDEPETKGDDKGAHGIDPRYQPASTGSSENAAVAGFTDPDFHFSYYLERMVQLISQYWQPPPLRRQIQMTVGFDILRDGTVQNVRVLESSGLRSFDDAGLRALETASPMPPLPRGYQKPSLGVNLIIRNLGDSP